MDERERADRLLAAIVDLYAEDDPEADEGDGPWWAGTCDSVLATAEAEGLLAEYGAEPVWWGGFRRGGRSSGHCWAQVGRIVVDPTVQQFGLPAPLVVEPGDPLYGAYRS